MFGSKVPELKICIRLKQTRRSLLTRNENLFEQNFITFLTLSLSILKFVDKLLRRQHLSVYMKCRVEYQSDAIMIKSVNSGLQKGKNTKTGSDHENEAETPLLFHSYLLNHSTKYQSHTFVQVFRFVHKISE